MNEGLIGFLRDKKILILGFGKEGRSTYRFLNEYVPYASVAIADRRPSAINSFEALIPEKLSIYSGEDYLKPIGNYDVVIKSPGINRNLLKDKCDANRITSQTNLFLQFFRDRIIGVTGTKGKSTTSSLISHILHGFDHNTILAGNIGVPPFDHIGKINDSTHIVYELSSHQLDDVTFSPHIAVMLNLYEEHLDHYGSFEKYCKAKSNIFRFQEKRDYLIVNYDDRHLRHIPVEKPAGRIIGYSVQSGSNYPLHGTPPGMIRSEPPLPKSVFNFAERKSLSGEHNLKNIMAATGVSLLLGIPKELIEIGVNSFEGLPHRMEFIGTFKGIRFFNDSIATVPEATIEALKTLKDTDTLILGGKDRGINYATLISFLSKGEVRNFILMGDAGNRIGAGLGKKLKRGQRIFRINEFKELVDIIPAFTETGKICLLSPAASSYDWFTNFEERGKAFKKIAENL